MSFVFVAKKDLNGEYAALSSCLNALKIDAGVLCTGEAFNHRAVLFKTLFPLDESKRRQLTEVIADADVMVTETLPDPKKPGALVLDMDMTSVQIEGIDEIARELGVYEEVAAITSEAMHGKLDFATSLRRRVAKLKGGNALVLDNIKARMPETEGLSYLMEQAKLWQRGICSGGFVQLICVLEQKYGLDLVKANCLEIADGKFTGQVIGSIVDAQAKQDGVLMLKDKLQLDKSQIMVLGDGANDLKMIQVAGLGIAYHAKPVVRETAPYAINHCDLTAAGLLLKLSAEALYGQA